MNLGISARNKTQILRNYTFLNTVTCEAGDGFFWLSNLLSRVKSKKAWSPPQLPSHTPLAGLLCLYRIMSRDQAACGKVPAAGATAGCEPTPHPHPCVLTPDNLDLGLLGNGSLALLLMGLLG